MSTGTGIYALDEAIADALASPLEYIGTGPWHGIFRIKACAYRNDRVLVVNVYCTTKEMPAFRVDVFSPTRGLATIYGEADGPISTRQRIDYFTFKAETHRSPPDRTVKLSMSLAQLRAFDTYRYNRHAGACWGGHEIQKRSASNPPDSPGRCSQDLEPMGETWRARNKPFLDAPPANWYRLVKLLRGLAPKHGKHVNDPGG